MAGPVPAEFNNEGDRESVRIRSFSIEGLFGANTHHIRFPNSDGASPDPSILILSGQNGSGKTTILRMIAGILKLDFDLFRKIPFQSAELVLSSEDSLSVVKTDDPEFPIKIRFRELSSVLYKTKDQSKLSKDQNVEREAVRELALPILQNINYDLLDIHRTTALWSGMSDRLDRLYVEPSQALEMQDIHFIESQMAVRKRIKRSREPETPLAGRVKTFIKDAQVNYRRFFTADDLSLLPRLLERLETSDNASNKSNLLGRVSAVQARYPSMKRFGLQTDDADLSALTSVLRDEAYQKPSSLALLETYVEMQERQNKARELIAQRLEGFESIMNEFLVGKSIRIDARNGLAIHTKDGFLEETDLSSGEYHFLYMMVSALLCQTSGSVIAIDEPELSLHVTWQRKILGALAKCAARASPTFVFATHSSAIAAEHADKVYSLSPIE